MFENFGCEDFDILKCQDMQKLPYIPSQSNTRVIKTRLDRDTWLSG